MQSVGNMGLTMAFKSCLAKSLRYIHFFQRRRMSQHAVSVSKAVSDTLGRQMPVVALESTIITHGMPYPDNIQTALEIEDIVRKEGCVPATIAVINGEVKVGLTKDDLHELSEAKLNNKYIRKVSRRDLPVAVTQGISGGTTVSATMAVAARVGIPVFVTGGIGGVHRGAAESFDISSDLVEMSRNKVAVVCAGVKSILDIGRTLEYLETLGVPVVTYNAVNGEFPAFFTPTSGFTSPHDVSTPEAAAQLLDSCWTLGLNCGVLIAVPVPEDQAADGEQVECAIKEAVTSAENKGISGQDVTPFVLDRVAQITGGKSVKANINAIKNNAVVGSRIALAYSRSQGQNRLRTSDRLNTALFYTSRSNASGHVARSDRPVVIGATNVDVSVTLPCAALTGAGLDTNGSTYSGAVSLSFGGVGRNLADGLSRLDCSPLFISAVGDDSYSRAILSGFEHIDMRAVAVQSDLTTAIYCAMLNDDHNVMFGISDCDIHASIDTTQVGQYESDIVAAPLVLVDGNLPPTTIDSVCQLCNEHRVPVWFEPADVHTLCIKPFTHGRNTWKLFSYISPNLAELNAIFQVLGITSPSLASDTVMSNNVNELELHEYLGEVARSCRDLLEYIPCIRIGLGQHGVLLCTKSVHVGLSEIVHRNEVRTSNDVYSFYHYPAMALDESSAKSKISCSGGGDSMVCGMVYGLLNGHGLHRCMLMGLAAANLSMQSVDAIPSGLSPEYILNISSELEKSYHAHQISLSDK